MKQEILEKFVNFIVENDYELSSSTVVQFAYQNSIKFSILQLHFGKNLPYDIIDEVINNSFEKFSLDSEYIVSFTQKIKSIFSAYLMGIDYKFFVKISQLCFKNPVFLLKISSKIASFIMTKAGGDMTFNYYTKRAILTTIVIGSMKKIAKNHDLKEVLPDFNSKIDKFVSNMKKVKSKFCKL